MISMNSMNISTARITESDDYLEINFRSIRVIKYFRSQGRNVGNQHVRAYKIQYWNMVAKEWSYILDGSGDVYVSTQLGLCDYDSSAL